MGAYQRTGAASTSTNAATTARRSARSLYRLMPESPMRTGGCPWCCECSGLGRGLIPDEMHGRCEGAHPPWRSGTRTGCASAHRPAPPPAAPGRPLLHHDRHRQGPARSPYAAGMSDDHLRETTVERRVVHRGRFMTFRVDTIEDAGGKRHPREIVEHPGAVCVIPVAGDEVLMVRQWRTPVERVDPRAARRHARPARRRHHRGP